ncbi:MAG TPA: tetratricopeptide repeat protein [Polyangium sp.]|nr:tetratricopeptide repeat protein [Polyangium sp.]
MTNEQNYGLPPQLEQLRQKAKQFRRELNHEKAYETNKQLAEESRRAHCEIGEVLGVRFMGVCAYRLGRYDESRALLVQAGELADAYRFNQQKLYIANHLGATLRHLGHFEEAYETFRGALEKARFPEDLEARARLLGSLGAFYDEIGNLQGADDCYARYEELVALIVSSGKTDDTPRLANARAFAGRAALRRGDLETARAKHDDEYRIALESKDQLRIGDAIFHQAKIRLELGLRSKDESHFNQAAIGFEQARERFVKHEQRNRMADVQHHWARLYEARSQWAEAYAAWIQSWTFSCNCKHLYRQAQSSLELARFCQRWALHGESLYWFRQAARIRVEQYAPLEKSKRIVGMVQTRVTELQEVAKKLADESRRVEREKDESDEINELVKKVTGKTIAELATGSTFESVHDWQIRIRKESLERWRTLISPERFEQLQPQSQGDLVMADMLYHGIVDELPRSALLIAIVVERELRERVFVPIHEAYEPHRTAEKLSWGSGRPPATVQYLYQDHSDNVPIGNAFRMIQEILGKSTRHAAVNFARHHTRSWHDKLKLIARLNDAILPVGLSTEGIPFDRLRNEAAHGGQRAANLDRMTVDAMKRRLFLESPMILASILEMDLRRS